MKRIEDLPEELQRIFQQVWYSIEPIDGQFPGGAYIAERFFLAGFDTAMATGGLLQRPKRTITNLIKLDGQIYVISNDGKLFEWRSYPDLPKYKNLDNWSQFPDLPQD